MNVDDGSFDARIRAALTELPMPDQAATQVALTRVRVGRRRRLTWVALSVAAAVVLIVTAAAEVPRMVGGEATVQPVAPVGSPQGTWDRDASVPEQPSWAGRWTVSFGSGAVLDVTGPPGARDAADGSAYRVAGEQVVIDAFINSECAGLAPGTYRWQVASDELRLVAVTDECRVRKALFSGVWSAVT